MDFSGNDSYTYWPTTTSQAMPMTSWSTATPSMSGSLYPTGQGYVDECLPMHMSRSYTLDTLPSSMDNTSYQAPQDVNFVDLAPVSKINRTYRPTYVDRHAVVDPTAEDFSTYIDLNAGEANKQPRRISNVPSEPDEGRYRTDVLYFREPARDGLYHCPFEAEGCHHPRTKLKCNYESVDCDDGCFADTASKYIDSHLRPFKCKLSTCTKQSFSSTACLLRHEREAHGMHGHGKCPYLCEFEGCDRADPDKGFPRLYNLRDHMKRVHGWKESDEDARRSGRKRKTPTAKPAAPRLRTNVVSLDINQLEYYSQPMLPYSYMR